MADETDDEDTSQLEETEDGEETKTDTEGEESEGFEKKEPPPPPPTELHNSALFMAKYLDQKLDKLFAATEKIAADMMEMEKRVMTHFENTMKTEHDSVSMKIIALQNLVDDQGKMIRTANDKAFQQAHQLDELQNQEGAETGSESQTGTATTGTEGSESEAAGTESEAGDTTEGETTEGEETEGEEEVEE